MDNRLMSVAGLRPGDAVRLPGVKQPYQVADFEPPSTLVLTNDRETVRAHYMAVKRIRPRPCPTGTLGPH